MRILNVVAIGLLLIALSGCKMGKSGTVAVKVTPSIMKEIKSLDPSVVFLLLQSSPYATSLKSK